MENRNISCRSSYPADVRNEFDPQFEKGHKFWGGVFAGIIVTKASEIYLCFLAGTILLAIEICVILVVNKNADQTLLLTPKDTFTGEA